MLNELGEDLKYLLLAGIGAVATTAEKSKDVVEELVKKGQLTVSQGKVLNEELTRNMKNKSREAAETFTQKAEKATEQLNQKVETITEKLSQKAERVADLLADNKGDVTAQTVLDSLDGMSEEDRALIKQKLQEMENGHECEGECGQPSGE